MKQIDISKAVGFGWDSIKKDFGYLIVISLIVNVISFIPSLSRGESINALISFLVMIVNVFIAAGVIKIGLEYIDGKKPPIETLFSYGKYFWRIVGASILIGLIVLGGLILLIIPGFYWALKYQYVINLIVDKDLSIGEAMRESGILTKDIKLQLLLFDIVCLLIIILGIIVFGVGIFVAYPVVWLAELCVYRSLQKQSKIEETK